MKIFNKYKKLIRDLKKITLSQEDAKNMRQSFIEQISPEKLGGNVFDVKNLFITFNSFSYKTKTVSVFIMLMLIFSPFAYAAELSLPGDILYPVKTTINDQVKRAISKVIVKDSEYFEINLLKEKFNESEKVINTEEPLEEDKKDRVRTVIQKQINKAEKAIERQDEKLKKENKKTEKEINKESKDMPKKASDKLKDVLKDNEKTLKKLNL